MNTVGSRQYQYSRVQKVVRCNTCTKIAAATFEPTQKFNRDGQGSSIITPHTTKLPGQLVEESAMFKQMNLHQQYIDGNYPKLDFNVSPDLLLQANKRCEEVTSEYAKTFYLGTTLMTREKAEAIWAIYVWCRRTDELVDGPNSSRVTPAALDRWEERLEATFAGKPYDDFDAALTKTIERFPLSMQPFKDMIGGMRMDMNKSRYNTFDELYEYCYRVAGTVALMSNPIMGINEENNKGGLEPVYRAALALGTANQLTNILRDVGEDAKQRDRIYVPLDELEQFKISESEVLTGLHAPTTGKIDDRWRQFMQFQIQRADKYFVEAEEGVALLSNDARWPVMTALALYRMILQFIEKNDYDNFTKRAYVPKWRKLVYLPIGLLKAQLPVNTKQ